MPLPPASPSGTPDVDVYTATVDAAAAITSDYPTEVGVVKRTGYLTAARYVAAAALSGADTNSRTLTVTDPTTRVVTDGIVVDTTKNKGQWAAATAYTTGDYVTFGNQAYSCISTVTGGTGPGVDTTHWTAINAIGLGYLSSLTAAFTQDDVGKTIAGTGFTSAVIIAVLDAQTAQVTPNSAVRNALSTTIGAARTLATLALTSGVDLAANAEKDLTLSGTDTKVYKGDVIRFVSTHVGTGITDPGGQVQLEVTNYGEGSD